MKKLIFVDRHGVSRAPMAAALMSGFTEAEVVARGLKVQFPEPLNQKTEAILASNGIQMENYSSHPLTEEDITEDTMLFAMEEDYRQEILKRFEKASEENSFLLSAYVGDELEIMDPYGGPLQSYGICFEQLRQTLVKLAASLQEKH